MIIDFYERTVVQVIGEQEELTNHRLAHIMDVLPGVELEVHEHVLHYWIKLKITWVKGRPQVELSLWRGLDHANLDRQVVETTLLL